VLRAAGVLGGSGWQNAPTRTMRCKTNGYLVPLDLSNWSERLSFFLGRHHEIATALFLHAAVRSGETFIDIGANVGFITLHAAAIVGPHGLVHTFEPNPQLAERLRHLVSINKLNQVTLHPVGLSDAAGEMKLRIINNHPGQGTLSHEIQSGVVTKEYHVPVCVPDEVLPADLRGPATIKIDVEGYELRVLRGLQRTLDRLHPVIFSEVSDDYLRRAGNSVAALFQFMKSIGYTGYEVRATRQPLRRTLRLVEIYDPATVFDENVVWLHPKSPTASRLSACLSEN
jgi:FkbM family methyltransferase